MPAGIYSPTLRANPNPNMYGISPGSKDYAAQTYAAMTRDQWANYVNTFVPLENQLIQYATDPGQVTKAMTNASADVNASFNQQEGAVQRRLRDDDPLAGVLVPVGGAFGQRAACSNASSS